MASHADLTGAGMPPLQALMLGNSPTTLAGAGTSSQTTAATILSHLVEVTAPTAADTYGVILPTGRAIGTPYFIFNSSAQTILVYAPVGHFMNTAASATPLSLTTHKGVIFIQYKPSYWMTILTA